MCPEPRTVECDIRAAGETHILFVSETERVSCEAGTLSVSSQGTLSIGRHTVNVSNAEGETVCSSELTVEDSVAPVIEAKTIALWPPNHKFHGIAVEDCVSVRDACDESVQAEFIWASSDEPVDSIGDGHFSPDIKLDDCRHLSLRSERQGPENGRVYKLGVRAVDASGNQTEGECRVVVAHDQSGKEKGSAQRAKSAVAVADDEAYRLIFDGSDGSPTCGRADEEPGTPGDENDGGVADPEPEQEIAPQ